MKKIQRFWKKKYQYIIFRAVMTIQKYARKFIRKLQERQLKLYKIKIRLVLLRVKAKLKLMLKKKRIQQSKFKPQQANVLESYSKNLKQIIKIQRFCKRIRSLKAKKFQRVLSKIRNRQYLLNKVKLNKKVSKLCREKESFYISRYSLLSSDVQMLGKYIERSQVKFEQNWANYEQTLEKYLVSNPKEYKDWVEKKDDSGKSYWVNLKTLKEQKQHPAQTLYQINKKVLKKKAEEELEKNLEPIEEKKLFMIDSMVHLKSRLETDVKRQHLASRGQR